MPRTKSSVGKLTLTCPSPLKLFIFAAYFGIQPDTPSLCTTVEQTSVSACFNKIVYDNINETCSDKQTCSLTVSTDSLGDPCLLQNKQLFIQYQCVDSSFSSLRRQCPGAQANYGQVCVNTTAEFARYWCEYDNKMSIDCGPNKLIQISCAFYGIDSLFQCSGGFYSGAPTVCYAASSRKNLAARCDRQNSCNLFSYEWADFFGVDPCYGMTK